MLRRRLRKKVSPEAILIIKEIRLILSGQSVDQAFHFQEPLKAPVPVNPPRPLPVVLAKKSCTSNSASQNPSFNIDVTERAFPSEPLIYRLPTEILQMTANFLDVQCLRQLICTNWRMNRTLVSLLHKRCGLERSVGSSLYLTSPIGESGDRAFAFKAFRSFHRSAPSKWISASFTDSERIDESVEDFLFGLSSLTPGTVQSLGATFLKPMTRGTDGLSRVVTAARQLQVESLQITYPFATESHSFDSPLKINWLSLHVDLEQPLTWNLLRSAADDLITLFLTHDSPSLNLWMPEPQQTLSRIDFTPLQTLNLGRLRFLSVDVGVPPHILAEFLHRHPTLEELELSCFVAQSVLPSRDIPITHGYVYSLKRLSGPADYLDVLLRFSAAPLELDWLKFTLSGCMFPVFPKFKEILICIGRCKSIRALGITLPENVSEDWFSESSDCVGSSERKSAIKTIRLMSPESGDAPENGTILRMFDFWRDYAPEANDLQYTELAWRGGRDELTRMIRGDGPLKVSIRSGTRRFQNEESIRPYNWR